MTRALTGAILFCLVSPFSVFGQALGNIVGTVTDQEGAVAPQTKVTVVNEGTQFTRVTYTNAAGQYVADSFPTGSITITAERPGFEKLVRSGVQLTAADTVTVNLQLALGSVQQTVEVTGEASLVQSQTASVSTLVNSTQTMEMPLNERSFTNLLQLSAGASPSTPGMTANLTGYTMNGAVAITMNGAPSNGNAYLIDGLYNRQLWTDYLIMNPPIEAVQETRILASDYSVQYGNAAGSVTIVLTKSGTNQFHGSAYEFLRNSATDANTFFSNAAGKPKPAYHRNEYGVTIGGPIRRDKTFFFADYQGVQIVQPTTEVDTIPSLAQQQMVETGNFSNLGKTIYNPFATTTVNGTTARTAFPNNMIPVSMLDPAALKTIQMLPVPTSTSSSNNFTYNPEGTRTDNQGDIRLDQNIGSADRLFFKFSYEDSLGHAAAVLPVGPYIPPGVQIGPDLQSGGSGGIASIANWSITGNYTKVFGANIVNEVHFGAVRDDLNIVNYGAQYATATSLGIPNINISNTNTGIPAMSISGFTAIGDVNTYPEFTHQLSMPVEDIFSWVKGNHTIKLGGGYTRHRLDGHTSLAPRGQYSFQGAFTRQIGTTSSATALADFALGTSVSITNSEQFGPFGERMWDSAAYGEDVWRVTNRLTITYGLRWDVQPFPNEVNNRWSNISPVTGLFAVAGTTTQNVNGSCGSRLVCVDKGDFEPRVGLAQQLTADGKTVFRAGFGQVYWRTDNAGRTLNLNPPMGIIQSLAYNTNGVPGLLLSQGVPPLVQPNLSNPVELTGLYEGTPSHFKNTDALQFSADIQRQLPFNMLLDVGYVRTVTDHEIVAIDDNQAVPGPGAYGPRRPLYSINPALGDIDFRTNAGQAKYNALQTKVNKRFSHGLSASLAWTWSHNMAETSRPQNSQCYSCEWGNTGDDRTHMIVINHVYDLPFGKGREFVNQGFLSTIVGGWALTGVWTKYTGTHFTPSLASSVSNSLPSGVTSTVAAVERPNLNGVPNLPSSQQTITHWFNVGAFSSPLPYTFGNAGNGILVGPGYFDLDLGIHRTFRVKERVSLQFRAEMFNALNHVNFNNPNATIGSTSAGVISATYPARVMQGALKLTF